MFRLFCVAFVIFPFFGLWKEGAMSGFWFTMTSIVILGVCLVQTATRADRTPIYEIFSRMVLTVYLPMLVFWWVIGNDADIGFWETTWYCFFGASILIAIGYVVVMGGMLALGLTAEARATGHHPYWDSLIPLWNPHSIMASRRPMNRASATPSPAPTRTRPASASSPFPTIPVKRK